MGKLHKEMGQLIVQSAEDPEKSDSQVIQVTPYSADLLRVLKWCSWVVCTGLHVLCSHEQSQVTGRGQQADEQSSGSGDRYIWGCWRRSQALTVRNVTAAWSGMLFWTGQCILP